MNWGRITEVDCVNTAPPVDERCSDPAFALANPGLCPAESRLVIKPEVGMGCVFDSIQFRAFLVQNGNETDVTDDAIFSSSDLNVAPVGAMSGNATGLSPGVATITAAYEGMSGNATFTVMDCDSGAGCESQHVAMMIMVDVTRSMSLAFGGGYAKRLDFAKAAATRFIGEVNDTKDYVGLMTFTSDSFTVLSPPTADIATVGGLVAGIAQTQVKTAFYDALDAAIAELAAMNAERQVIVLITDGESTAGTDTGSTSPFTLLSNFKNGGGIVMCLGCRASGTGFATLSSFSTGGFFINAYPTVAADSLDYFSGLKGYICAGNCTPEGDVVVSRGTINYTSFINWDVLAGYVDLQGNNFFDYRPNNGLYVDLVSGMQPSGAANPVLRSKTTYTLEAGHVYRLTVQLAGNQIITRDADTVRVRVFYLNTDEDETPVYLLDQQISIADYTQDFTDYAFSFTATGAHDVYVSIQQENIPTDEPRAGLLLNSVIFEDRTDLIVLLEDDFDDENQEYIAPACGAGTYYTWLPDLNGYGYATGYNCYGDGCLDDPPPTQLPDPNPLSNIESGTTPPVTTYESTQEVCLQCEDGGEDIGTSLVPVLSSTDTEATASSEATSGYGGEPALAPLAFDGNAASYWASEDSVPQWLQIDMTEAVQANWYGLTVLYVSKPTTWQLQGSDDGTNWTILDQQTTGDMLVPNVECLFTIASPDAYRYYRLYVVKVSNTITLPDLTTVDRVAIINLSLYAGTTEEKCASATETSTISQADAISKATDAATLAAQALLNCPQTWTVTQFYTAKCKLGSLGQDVIKSATVTSAISEEDAETRALAQAKAEAEAELDCSLSNNGQETTINDCLSGSTTPAQASPYPSVKFVSGETGVVSKVTVQVNGLSHTTPEDILMLLRAPDGSTCLLIANCGGTNVISDVDLVFDDAAGSSLPFNALISAGTFKPTQYAPYADLPAPGPATPYGTTLSVFNGINPNGSWSLWIADDTTGDTGTLASWDLTITTVAGSTVYAMGDTINTGYRSLAESLAALVPANDVLLYLGDVHENISLPDTAWVDFYNWGFGDLLDRIVFTPGNHDWSGESATAKANTQAFWAGLFPLAYGASFPGTMLVTDPDNFNYSYKIGGWKIISFNCEANHDDAFALMPGGSVYEFLETELAEAGYNFILISHRPRWANDTGHGDNADLDDIWQLSCTHHVVAWLSGHSHIAMIGAPRNAAGAVAAGPSQIVAGVGAPSFYAFDGAYLAGAVLWDDNSEPLMCRLTLKATSIDVVFVDVHGLPVAASATTINTY